MSHDESNVPLAQTALYDLHQELGARMVPFAGYSMPVQYPAGILREHEHTREAAGLFDVSHMGQVVIEGAGTAEMLESLVPVDVKSLGVNQQTYALFTNDKGGVLDDLIITRWSEERFFLVVNAACKTQDIAHLSSALSGQSLTVLENQSLLALQGPKAREVMAELVPAAAALTFMQGASVEIDGHTAYVTCSGYTGEDGFEISLPDAAAVVFAKRLLADKRVEPIGLGARDSLRLEAGLCLYGHELTQDITPVEASLLWSVSKTRRADGARAGGFPGAKIIFAQMSNGVDRKRVGLKVDGKRPVREGQSVCDDSGAVIGEICSAGFGATIKAPIAMAYVNAAHAKVGTELTVEVRGKHLPVTVTKMPFHPQRYYRG